MSNSEGKEGIVYRWLILTLCMSKWNDWFYTRCLAAEVGSAALVERGQPPKPSSHLWSHMGQGVLCGHLCDSSLGQQRYPFSKYSQYFALLFIPTILLPFPNTNWLPHKLRKSCWASWIGKQTVQLQCWGKNHTHTLFCSHFKKVRKDLCSACINVIWMGRFAAAAGVLFSCRRRRKK